MRLLPRTIGPVALAISSALLIGALPSTADQGLLFSSAVINGAEGGTVSAGRFTVTIPPGAYRGNATVTVTVPTPKSTVCQLDIFPRSANTFAAPVILTADCKDQNKDSLPDLVIATFDESSLSWKKVPGSQSDVFNAKVTAPLFHFSLYEIIDGRSGW